MSLLLYSCENELFSTKTELWLYLLNVDEMHTCD